MSDAAKTKILLVDDHALVLDGISRQLEAEAHLEIVGQVSDGHHVMQAIQQLKPDIVLMDIGLPGINGLDVAKAIRRKAPTTKVIILSMYDQREFVQEALRAGARAYVLKSAPSSEIIQAINAVKDSGSFFSDKIAQDAMTEYMQVEEVHPSEQLTSRECEVLTWIATGESNKEIAHRLSISVRTVETHREKLMRKLQIRTTAGLTRYAIAEGLYPPPMD